MKIESKLLEFGISRKESRAYIGLLKYGTLSISRLAQLVDLNRGTAYVALHRLLDLGLVSKVVEGRVIHFSANPPEALKRLHDRQLSTLEHSREQMNTLLPQIVAGASRQRPAPSVRYLLGTDGAIEAFEEMKKGLGDICRVYMSPVDGINVVGVDYINALTAWRISKGCLLRAVRPVIKKQVIHPDYQYTGESSPTELREVRYLPEGYTFRATQYCLEDRVVIIAASKTGYSVVIESHQFAQLQRDIFDTAWNKLKR